MYKTKVGHSFRDTLYMSTACEKCPYFQSQATYWTLVGLRGWFMRVEALAKRDRKEKITEERRLKAQAKKRFVKNQILLQTNKQHRGNARTTS